MSGVQRVVIVGGGPAGLSAARGYREAGGKGQVTIVTAEDHPPYSRPPLTKDYLRGEGSRAQLAIEPPEWFPANRVELLRSRSVTEVDPERRVVVVEGQGELGYDACVLATGSEPVRPPVPGVDAPGIAVMRTIEHSESLRERAGRGIRATVVGSGFIGCEVAASLAMGGAEVTIVSNEEVPQAARLGEEAGALIAGWLSEHGVTLRMGAGAESIDEAPGANGGPAGTGRWKVRLEGGGEVNGDVVVLGAGVEPRLELARGAELDVEAGAIAAGESLESSRSGIWVAGDVAFALNAAAGRRLSVEHWGEALNQGRVAGAAIAGAHARWDVVPGFWSTIGERTLKHAAWGDGWDEARLVEGDDGGFTVWYGSAGRTVGVLTHGRDEDYERGGEMVRAGSPLP